MNDNNLIFDATSETFDELVLTRSQSLPVVVDFWASWCGPCRVLMPLLDKLAADYDGLFALAKVNSDAESELAARFGVRNLPTVKIFRNGQVVDEFMGAQPESAIRKILDRHVERESDRLRAQATELHKQGDESGALAALVRAHELDSRHEGVIVDLARARLHQGDGDAAEQLFRQLPASAQLEPNAQAVATELRYARALADAPDQQTLEQSVAENPGDLQARYQLGLRYVQSEHYEEALDQFLEIMLRDREFGDDLGRRSALEVFQLLGPRDERVARYRTRMAAALY
jgi:putative thioredoxin